MSASTVSLEDSDRRRALGARFTCRVGSLQPTNSVEWLGNGVLVAPRFVLTCYHVVRGRVGKPNEVYVPRLHVSSEEWNGGASIASTVVWHSNALDYGVLKNIIGPDADAHRLDLALLRLDAAPFGNDADHGVAFAEMSVSDAYDYLEHAEVQHVRCSDGTMAHAAPRPVVDVDKRAQAPVALLYTCGEKGLSGSPVLAADGRLLALHASSEGGLPASVILRALERHCAAFLGDSWTATARSRNPVEMLQLRQSLHFVASARGGVANTDTIAIADQPAADFFKDATKFDKVVDTFFNETKVREFAGALGFPVPKINKFAGNSTAEKGARAAFQAWLDKGHTNGEFADVLVNLENKVLARDLGDEYLTLYNARHIGSSTRRSAAAVIKSTGHVEARFMATGGNPDMRAQSFNARSPVHGVVDRAASSLDAINEHPMSGEFTDAERSFAKETAQPFYRPANESDAVTARMKERIRAARKKHAEMEFSLDDEARGEWRTLGGVEYWQREDVFDPEVFFGTSFILDALKVGRTFLEIGCGNAVICARALLDGAARVHGVDLSRAAVAASRKTLARAVAEAQIHVQDGRRPFDIYHGNVFALEVSLLKYDTIFWNHPFTLLSSSEKRKVQGDGDLERDLLCDAVGDVDYVALHRFLAHVRKVRSERGCVYLAFSPTVGCDALLERVLLHYGWRARICARYREQPKSAATGVRWLEMWLLRLEDANDDTGPTICLSTPQTRRYYPGLLTKRAQHHRGFFRRPYNGVHWFSESWRLPSNWTELHADVALSDAEHGTVFLAFSELPRVWHNMHEFVFAGERASKTPGYQASIFGSVKRRLELRLERDAAFRLTGSRARERGWHHCDALFKFQISVFRSAVQSATDSVDVRVEVRGERNTKVATFRLKNTFEFFSFSVLDTAARISNVHCVVDDRVRFPPFLQRPLPCESLSKLVASESLGDDPFVDVSETDIARMLGDKSNSSILFTLVLLGEHASLSSLIRRCRSDASLERLLCAASLRIDSGKRTALHWAAYMSAHEMIDELAPIMRSCSNFDFQVLARNRTPLHYASISGDGDTIRAVLRHFPTLKSVTNTHERNALHYLVRSASARTVREFASTDFAAMRTMRDSRGATAADYARIALDEEVRSFLERDDRDEGEIETFFEME